VWQFFLVGLFKLIGTPVGGIMMYSPAEASHERLACCTTALINCSACTDCWFLHGLSPVEEFTTIAGLSSQQIVGALYVWLQERLYRLV
jgi:hypothetical protein